MINILNFYLCKGVGSIDFTPLFKTQTILLPVVIQYIHMAKLIVVSLTSLTLVLHMQTCVRHRNEITLSDNVFKIEKHSVIQKTRKVWFSVRVGHMLGMWGYPQLISWPKEPPSRVQKHENCPRYAWNSLKTSFIQKTEKCDF